VDTSHQAAGQAGCALGLRAGTPPPVSGGAGELPAGAIYRQDLQANSASKRFDSIPAELGQAYEAGQGTGLDQEAGRDGKRCSR
jgi:hypothetical protein